MWPHDEDDKDEIGQLIEHDRGERLDETSAETCLSCQFRSEVTHTRLNIAFWTNVEKGNFQTG